MAMERRIDDHFDEADIRRLAEVNFGRSIGDGVGDNKSDGRENSDLKLPQGQSVRFINGKRMIDTDLGTKGLGGCLAAANIRR